MDIVLDKNIPIKPNKQEFYQVYKKLKGVIPSRNASQFLCKTLPVGSIIYIDVSATATRNGFVVAVVRKGNVAILSKIEQGISFVAGTNGIVINATGGDENDIEYECSVTVLQNLTE